jgi:hypothetical protein
MVGDPSLPGIPPATASDEDLAAWRTKPDDPVECNPGPAPPGLTQEEWDAYCRRVVLAWRDRPSPLIIYPGRPFDPGPPPADMNEAEYRAFLAGAAQWRPPVRTQPRRLSPPPRVHRKWVSSPPPSDAPPRVPCWCGAPGVAYGVTGHPDAVAKSAREFPEAQRWYCLKHQPDVSYMDRAP